MRIKKLILILLVVLVATSTNVVLDIPKLPIIETKLGIPLFLYKNNYYYLLKVDSEKVPLTLFKIIQLGEEEYYLIPNVDYSSFYPEYNETVKKRLDENITY